MNIGGMSKNEIFKYIEQKREQEIKEQEQKIFTEFEDKGYHITTNDKYLVIFDSEKQFIIDKVQKQYFVSNWVNEHNRYCITCEEHQLLHKLFELWGWFDE